VIHWRDNSASDILGLTFPILRNCPAGEPMKGENKASEKGSDVRKGNQSERVSSVEKVGSTGAGIKFGVPAHPDKSVVTKGKMC